VHGDAARKVPGSSLTLNDGQRAFATLGRFDSNGRAGVFDHPAGQWRFHGLLRSKKGISQEKALPHKWWSAFFGESPAPLLPALGWLAPFEWS
jgi:hypothetical protein